VALFGRRSKNPQEMNETERRRKALDAERSALLFLKGGLLRPAEADLRRCVELAPDYAAGHNYLGMVLYRLGELEEAAAALTTAVTLAPADETLRRTYGTILEAQGRTMEAQEEYAAATSLDPESGWAHAALGAILFKQGDLAAAEAHLVAATTLNPSDIQALADLAELRRQRGSVIGSIDAIQRALAVFADLDAPLLQRTGGMVAVHDSGARAAAAAPFHYQLGMLLDQNGDIDSAIGELRAALEHMDGDPHVVRALARSLIKRGRDNDAQHLYEREIKAHPANRPTYEADLYALLVDHSSLALGAPIDGDATSPGHAPAARPDPLRAATPPEVRPAATGRLPNPSLPEAITRLHTAIEADPTNTRLHRDLSIEYTRIGMLAEAKDYARRAEQLRAAHVQSHRNAG